MLLTSPQKSAIKSAKKYFIRPPIFDYYKGPLVKIK